MKLFLLVIKDFWLQETDIKIILYTVLDPKCFHLAIDVLGSPIPLLSGSALSGLKN